MPPSKEPNLHTSVLRILFRKATWYEAGLSLKRVHKDPRARKHLLGLATLVALVIVIPVVGIAYVGMLIGTGAWLFVPFVIPVMWWIRRSNKQEFEPLNIAPRPEAPPPALADPDLVLLRRFLAELTILYAVFLDRAGSERFQKEKQLPEGAEILTRRAHFELLRSLNLPERIAATDRDLLMTPDGHWEWETINRVAAEIDVLRLLRWILGLDVHLPLIGFQLRGDFTIAHELVLAPQKALDGTSIVDTDQIRVAHDAANAYLIRCFAEAVRRGCVTPKNPEAIGWAAKVSESLRGKQDEDLVLGSVLVSEAEDRDLMWAVTLARKRTQFLEWTLNLLQGAASPGTAFPLLIEDGIATPSRP
jgi:hypothetical protein